MWHYRPWKPIVDGKFLPKDIQEENKNVQEEPLLAFLPEHPNTLMRNGDFNKVSNKYFIILGFFQIIAYIHVRKLIYLK